MSTALVPLTLDQRKDFCKSIVIAGFLGTVASDQAKAEKVAEAVVKAQAGAELGIGPWASQTAFHNIQGKLAASSGQMAGLIRASGNYDYKIKVCNDTICTLIFERRRDDKWEELGEATFSLAEATSAGLTQKEKTQWKKGPSDMLFARAISRGFRRYTPHLAHGGVLYTPEDLGGSSDEDATAAITRLAKAAKPVVTQKPTDPGGGPQTARDDVIDVEDESIKSPVIDSGTYETIKAEIQRTGADAGMIARQYSVSGLEALTQEQAKKVLAVLSLNKAGK